MATTGISSGPFTYTAPGDLGLHRETMLSNELLLRDKLGHPRTRGFYLPGQGFTYGRPNEKRDFTAADALRGWGGGLSSLPINKKDKLPGRDFKAINRAAVSAGLMTAQEHYDYRCTHDIRCKPAAQEKTKGRTRRLPPSMVFGLPTRPSTPIYDLLEHKYQDKWIQQRYSQEQAQRKAEQQKKNALLLYNTRATLLRTYQNPVDDKPLWQMPRFTKSAKPHLQTFRTTKEKEDAFKNFDMDKVSRKGVFGTGVYEAAKN
ncbi:hypothetical protein BaRGS_00030875 [Batillaria attramentaria]|uniref:Cilia- and flagella-associated protein 77 n=1 Tax=Batillaria attramentaria TaxID=370345 RepID=A0ABD0JTC4_9CAEN